MHLKKSWIICLLSFILLELHLLWFIFSHTVWYLHLPLNKLSLMIFLLLLNSFSNIYLKYMSLLDSGSWEYQSILFKQCFLNLPDRSVYQRPYYPLKVGWDSNIFAIFEKKTKYLLFNNVSVFNKQINMEYTGKKTSYVYLGRNIFSDIGNRVLAKVMKTQN